MNPQNDFSSISRDEINDALARYLSNGGKIKKIKTLHNSISTIDPLADQENGSLDGVTNLSGISVSGSGSW